eukprot:g66140.t1
MASDVAGSEAPVLPTHNPPTGSCFSTPFKASQTTKPYMETSSVEQKRVDSSHKSSHEQPVPTEAYSTRGSVVIHPVESPFTTNPTLAAASALKSSISSSGTVKKISPSNAVAMTPIPESKSLSTAGTTDTLNRSSRTVHESRSVAVRSPEKIGEGRRSENCDGSSRTDHDSHSAIRNSPEKAGAGKDDASTTDHGSPSAAARNSPHTVEEDGGDESPQQADTASKTTDKDDPFAKLRRQYSDPFAKFGSSRTHREYYRGNRSAAVKDSLDNAEVSRDDESAQQTDDVSQMADKNDPFAKLRRQYRDPFAKFGSPKTNHGSRSAAASLEVGRKDESAEKADDASQRTGKSDAFSKLRRQKSDPFANLKRLSSKRQRSATDTLDGRSLPSAYSFQSMLGEEGVALFNSLLGLARRREGLTRVTQAHIPLTTHLISSHLISSHLISSRLVSSRLVSSRLVSSHLIASHRISSHLISSHLSSLISSHLISPPHLTSSHHISSHLISSHLILSHLISSYLISSHLIPSHPIPSHPIPRDAHSRAWQFKAYIIKFVIRARLLFVTGQIPISHLAPFDEPFNRIGTLLLEVLETKKSNPKLVDSGVKPTLFCGLLRDMFANFLALVRPYLPDSLVNKADEAFSFFAGPDFVLGVLNEKAHDLEKRRLTSVARRLFRPLLLPICKQRKCNLSQVESRDKFAGSLYCAKHHQERYEKMLSPPNFDMFVNTATSDFDSFPDYVIQEKSDYVIQEKSGDMNLINFYLRVKDFRLLEKVAVRTRVAESICTRYLDPGAEKHFAFPAELEVELRSGLEKINEARSLGQQGLKPGLFGAMEKSLEAYLKLQFEQYIQTDRFRNKLAAVELPQSVLDEMKAAEEKQTEEDLDHLSCSVISFSDEVEIYILPFREEPGRTVQSTVK